MEIIIKGSPEELSELLAGLRTGQTAGAKKSAPQAKTAEQNQINSVLDKINTSASKVTDKALRI